MFFSLLLFNYDENIILLLPQIPINLTLFIYNVACKDHTLVIITFFDSKLDYIII